LMHRTVLYSRLDPLVVSPGARPRTELVHCTRLVSWFVWTVFRYSWSV
jgi:hypothetical protein